MTGRPLITESQFRLLNETIPDLTANQLWDIADIFGRRIVETPRGNTTTTSDTQRANQRIGFTASEQE